MERKEDRSNKTAIERIEENREKREKDEKKRKENVSTHTSTGTRTLQSEYLMVKNRRQKKGQLRIDTVKKRIS